ncbi:hypothetical protein JSQ81_01190 [Sporosarcina sp. Marseille-Q4063]|uniref:hypothetical protein n=1 Tax=Sporosarcina sp. Marseille-Q4063 TaxID=2810514 RepID=UPI001BAEE506|nr:hypothetical protein [Sporosarcina sp. Marseille-Q4063]QUW22241.1 hypothetical protein JSQ81_01190 [Sporosarcina sp. Marseille-Q4063]
MRNYRFGIDIDGTVTCPTALLPHINKQYQVELVLDDIKEYDLTKAFSVDPKQFYEWYKTAEAMIYDTSPPQEFAKEILESWLPQYELFYISARGENVLDTTTDWFKREEIPYDHIELIGSHYKIEAAKKHNVHAFFEDKHDNAVDISEELDIPVILFDTPYNRKPIPESVIRVYDWQEANKWIQRLFPIETAVTK